MITRRMFLGRCAQTSVLVPFLKSGLFHLPGLEPQGAEGRVLVLLELMGGNDGLNTVIPYRDEAYFRARPTIHPAKDSILKVHDSFGFHPNLRGFEKLFKEGRLGVIHGVGYPQPDRSHFRSADIWHTACLCPEKQPLGWLGRLADQLGAHNVGATPSLVIGQSEVPRALYAARNVSPAIMEEDHLARGSGPEEGQQARRDLIRALGAPRAEDAESTLGFLRTASKSAFDHADRVEAAMSVYASTAEYPASALAQKLKLAAKLIAGEYPTTLYYLTQGGYDTHSLQAATHGFLLSELGDALSAFCQDLQDLSCLERTAVVLYSEFGRRVEENGSRGTDHGAAAPVFVAGGNLKNNVIGDPPSLEDLVDGDVRHAVDFRRVYATLLEDRLCLDSTAILGERFERLPLYQEV